MAQKEWDMQSLSEVFLQSVRSYGIKEVSMEQYEAVCKKIIRFSSEKGFRTYYQGLRADYDAWIDEKKSKVGYEIPFTRYFYKYQAPQPSAEIMVGLFE